MLHWLSVAAAAQPSKGGGLWSNPQFLFTVVISFITAVSLAWAITRSQALKAWRDAAEGFKEQTIDLTSRLERAENLVLELNRRIDELEALPNLTDLHGLITERATQSTVAIVKEIQHQADLTRREVRRRGEPS